tara:strand:- start:4240 stop:5106 length:867 start_codon:yes stop_codon:yes gene_type:complete
MIALYIITVGCLVAVNGAILGSVLLLRRMSMMCDAIVHAILPGLVVAYLITSSRGSFAMLFGAIGSGIIAATLVEFVHLKFRITREASIGLMFTTLFSIGIILLALFAGQVKLDQDCVLFGELAYVPLDLWITDEGLNLGPYPIWTLAFLTIGVVTYVSVGFRPLVLCAFDKEFARLQGIKVQRWHYSLMLMLSLAAVTSFQAVGAIMVMGFFILPPATAYLFISSVRSLILLSSSIGILCVVSGFYLAQYLNVSIAGCIITLNGFVFFSALASKLYLKLNLSPVRNT